MPKEKRTIGRIGNVFEEEVMYITQWQQSLLEEGSKITIRVDNSGKENGWGTWLVISDKGVSAWTGSSPVQVGLSNIDVSAWKKEKYVHVSICEVDYS